MHATIAQLRADAARSRKAHRIARFVFQAVVLTAVFVAIFAVCQVIEWSR